MGAVVAVAGTAVVGTAVGGGLVGEVVAVGGAIVMVGVELGCCNGGRVLVDVAASTTGWVPARAVAVLINSEIAV